ncbi:Obg family GTPase CgtA [Candidatus Adlerbacteria bacterium RIFCSPHIGHO2_02_FULL_52_17]|uniref:GTPase Obg n=1 Tax=Candidatus Adlerbacteria bacterium RIFCSPHIGHO2_02_FULL_52_17 TaxID=1797240 RepID=A0A1F4XS14_9BACT|nr:MAG: Obg family GTPase CgtA [Candidatus Adlerbacteria bacterium RIFCSPHIGHO2_02_FULL_52_17]
MAFVDELIIAARAGHGGDGVVRWLHEKGKEYSGPAGGNGGDGGDFYIRGVRDIGLLARYRGEKRFEAGRGEPGASASMHGARGKDYTLDLPVGSLVTNTQTREQYELLKEGERQMVLKGGRGGAGNAVFKSSVNRSPKESTPGARGEEAQLHIELRLIADAGLMGLPNAGKTSLLNALTGTERKVGSYAFTTLDPNLGVLYGFVLADIPGLIEGAGSGKGLGFKFLRHIARTKMLIHCVSVESDDPLRDYRVVRNEISRFEDGSLAKKPEIVVLTKSDTKSFDEIAKMSKQFKKEVNGVVTTVSVLDDTAVKNLKDTIVSALR